MRKFQVFYTERNKHGDVSEERSTVLLANSEIEAFEKFDEISNERMVAHKAEEVDI